MKLHSFLYLTGIAILLAGFTACSKMDDTYKEFIKNGERIYIGKADSVKIYPGKDRLKIRWLAISDPRIVRVKIYWNNRTDSTEVQVNRTVDIDTVDVMLENMAEGDYSFDIITFDNKGNTSIPVNAVGKVFGDQYQQSLLNRTVKSAINDGGLATLVLGQASEGAIFSEVQYADISGQLNTRNFPAKTDTIQLENFKAGTSVQYRTAFLPDSMSIDTFYTAYESVRVKGAPVEYSKLGWSITASSFRAANPPEYAIDNNPGSVWINDTGAGVGYPYMLTVDMKQVAEPVDGFTFTQRTDKNGAITSPSIELCEIEVSNDGQGWQSLGLFTLKEIPGSQYFDLPDSKSFRYFRTTFKSSYGNVPNGAIAEIGIYAR